jgi:hypothetical protein
MAIIPRNTEGLLINFVENTGILELEFFRLMPAELDMFPLEDEGP